jgi:hypothetical protein
MASSGEPVRYSMPVVRLIPTDIDEARGLGFGMLMVTHNLDLAACADRALQDHTAQFKDNRAHAR